MVVSILLGGWVLDTLASCRNYCLRFGKMTDFDCTFVISIMAMV